MKKIRKGFILPSVALTIKPKQIKYYRYDDKAPEPGDVVYGVIIRIGRNSSLENASGRIHMIHHGTRAIFVFGNRYAPDYYEGLIPETMCPDMDLLSRSGMVGIVKTKSSRVKDATRVRILGYVCHEDGRVLNTRSYSLIKPKTTEKKYPRSRLILICGTSMNSGKSMAAAACCWALTSLGHHVKASKITGTAGLKDILHMNDAGATVYADFTHFGHPSTYLLPEDEVIRIFNFLDLKYGNNPKNYWIAELADGIIQRETAILLGSKDVTLRLHRFIFCAADAFGAIGGLGVLKERFGLVPDAISGVCSSSPLHLRELSAFSNIPVFNGAEADAKELANILLPAR